MPARLVLNEERTAIYDLTGSEDQARIESLLGLYERLFPRYRHYVPRMRRRLQYQPEHRPGHVVHYWLVEVDGQPAGIRTFRYVRGRRCGLAHALAVDPAFRDIRVRDAKLSIFVIHECLNQVIRDAVERSDPPPLGMVNEVEPDRLMEHYIQNGLVQLPIQYKEPIFPPPDENGNREAELAAITFSPMHLGFLPNPRLNIGKYTRSMIADFALAFLTDHYGLPADHQVTLEVLRTIRA